VLAKFLLFARRVVKVTHHSVVSFFILVLTRSYSLASAL